MEKNKISLSNESDYNETHIIIEPESYIHSFIYKIKSKYNKSEKADDINIHISGKILYYIEDLTIIYFVYKIPKNSKENLFKKDIIFSFEFIDKKVPYIKAISNFIFPTLFDGRNLFSFLVNNNKYIFDVGKLDECEKIINDIISGINKFIISLKENLDVKVLIYYGDYSLNHQYLINDFLINNTMINFFRINDLDNKFNNNLNNNLTNKNNINNIKRNNLKYIIITQLYFLVFEPVNENKSYAKLIQINHLKDVNIIIKNNEKEINKKTYYIKITKDINNNLLIKFILIHRNYLSKEEKLVIKKEDFECDYDDHIKFKDCLDEKKEDLNYRNYLLVIKNSKNLSAMEEQKDKSKKKKFISESRCNDYKKYIEYYELLYDYYKKKKNEENVKDKLKDIFSKLTFFCVELITFKDSDPKENFIYKSKLEKYSKFFID